MRSRLELMITIVAATMPGVRAVLID
uniref:Uncharacterized protein n=1 Tax=Arundo donax TaxID=35708 RepID=A0A0A8ZMM0_ARUDO